MKHFHREWIFYKIRPYCEAQNANNPMLYILCFLTRLQKMDALHNAQTKLVYSKCIMPKIPFTRIIINSSKIGKQGERLHCISHTMWGSEIQNNNIEYKRKNYWHEIFGKKKSFIAKSYMSLVWLHIEVVWAAVSTVTFDFRIANHL